MTIEELRERQGWTLPQKIDHSLGVIDQFASHFNGKVFVSFSGGKDSCVMLDLVKVVIPDVKCMFIMTGCESPSVCRFVRQVKADGTDIDIIRPEKTLRQVFAEYGFPLVSKEVSHDVQACRRNPTCKSSQRKLDTSNPHGIPDRWRYLLTEPYEVSDRCCFWLKKQPSHKYIKQTGRRPFLGLLADEGYTRQSAYVKRGGCNTFSETGKRYATSWPLAIWTNADVWQYINERHLPIPDIYDHGATRTGCLGCGFGAYKDKIPLDPLPRLWPKMYQAIMDYENNGIRYGDALAKSIERGHHRIQRKPKPDQPPADPTTDHPFIHSLSDGLVCLCYDWHNLEALCIPCHSRTHKEMGKGTKTLARQRDQQRFDRWIDNLTKKFTDNKTTTKTEESCHGLSDKSKPDIK